MRVHISQTSSSAYLLLVYRKATYFCMLILYLSTLLKLSVLSVSGVSYIELYYLQVRTL